MDAPPTDNDDTIADDTTAGTEAGPQNTPSQWQKHYVGLDQPLQPASPPRALPLCTYDEDETQIQFCSNVISQEVGSPMHHSKKNVMQLAEVELPLNKFDYELGDGESSNESEDLWAGGDATLEQQQQTSETSLHTQRADATSMADPLADAPEDPAATDTGNVDTEVEDNEGDDELATRASSRAVTTPADPEAFYDDLFQRTMPASTFSSPRKRRRHSATPVDLGLKKAPTTSPIHRSSSQNKDNLPLQCPASILSDGASTAPSETARVNTPRTLPETEAIASNKGDCASSNATLSPSVPQRRHIPQHERDSASDENRPPTSGRGRRANTKARAATVKSPAPCPSPIINTDAAAECISSGSTKAQLIRIVLTGLDPAPLMRKIEAIQGAVFEEDVSLGTHLVAPTNELKRTVKMLCGISTCQHIVGEKWLTASAKQGRPVPEAPYCLHDPAKEAQWAFDLKSTMYHRHDRHLLFRGRVFYIVPHKTILPAPSDLTKIIECAGGEVLPTGSSSTAHDDGVIVIASAEALAVKSIRKKLGKLIDAPMHTPELILSGVLQQSLDLTKHRVGIQHSMAVSKRKR
ncbi:hypothetical protein H310_00866 [Aphanomyces invadans]|uniref:BRCT domain-containing protein n=1 Tax=Aphanomyces invadans TaxID=157072 RepID=A0A024URG6_9STRA|nr:hypothetical protein H310_00866 [Aphanomyces invadans]ETW08223.1 hypothetical protein H310_00866 [Aphanomyces invadans]|eukprot:XP_008862028.1 hypothetical protein H310_00866 [Aphanomyces invadans]